jgi:hypothetical protein
VKSKRTEHTCDFAKSVKLHTRKTIENRLLSRTDNATINGRWKNGPPTEIMLDRTMCVDDYSRVLHFILSHGIISTLNKNYFSFKGENNCELASIALCTGVINELCNLQEILLK